MGSVLRSILLSLVAVGSGAAAEKCGFLIEVVDAAGNPLFGVPVSLIDSLGITRDRSASNGSSVELCNTGLGKHSVVIGIPGECGTVMITGLRFDPDRDWRLKAPYTPCPHVPRSHSTHCSVMLQVKDLESGVGLGDVEIQSDQWKQTLYGDSRGKVRFSVPFAETTAILIKRQGYHFAMIGVGCETGINFAERLVTLTRK